MTFNTTVVGCWWQEEQGQWKAKLRQTQPGGQVKEFEDTCDLLLHATGILNNFKWPNIEGIEKFKGKVRLLTKRPDTCVPDPRADGAHSTLAEGLPKRPVEERQGGCHRLRRLLNPDRTEHATIREAPRRVRPHSKRSHRSLPCLLADLNTGSLVCANCFEFRSEQRILRRRTQHLPA